MSILLRWHNCGSVCYCLYAVGRTTRRHPATSSRIFFPLHMFSPRSCHRLSTAEHRLSMLFFFSHENIFPLFHLNCSQNHAITSSFPVAVGYLESFRCLICSKVPFTSGIPIFSRIHLLVFRSVQLILSIRRHTHISKAVTSFSSHFLSAQLSGRIMRYSISVIVQVGSLGHSIPTLTTAVHSAV